MLSHKVVACLALLLLASASTRADEHFVGAFAEPRDGGNLDTTRSTFDGTSVLIVPRSHSSEAINGGTRWRNVHFAVRGVAGRAPVFKLPLTSPGTGKTILAGDTVSFQNLKLVWSYEPNAVKWNAFDSHMRVGRTSAEWRIDAQNTAPFTQDVVYVSVNERFPVADFYEWLEADVFAQPLVAPSPSEVTAGTFVIGYQSGAPASSACSRAIPDMPLFGFVIRDPAENPTKLVVLVSGQHPYEGQNKIALQAAVNWITKSTSPEARAYRAQFVTLVYPFVNPTGELAGLWRGTAYNPNKDTNRNWHTTETVPSRNRGIDTVIVHKNALKHDIATLGLGEPYAVLDYHQNFGDYPGHLDYVLHSSASTSTSAPVARRQGAVEFAAYFARLNSRTVMAGKPSNPSTQETLRGYMISRGAQIPLTFERSVYNTIASEWEFGLASILALVDPATVIVDPEVPPTTPEIPPAPEPVPEEPTPDPSPEDPAPAPGDETEPPQPIETDPEPPASPVNGPILIADEFTNGTNLVRRQPDTAAPPGSTWHVHTGVVTLATDGAATTKISSRATIEAGAADVQVSTYFRPGANTTGLILRASDSKNYLRFVITANGWSLQQTVGGSTKSLLSGQMPFVLAEHHTLSAMLLGPSIVLTIDGTTVGAAEVTFNQGATRHGLLSSNSGLRRWENFTVRGPAPGKE